MRFGKVVGVMLAGIVCAGSLLSGAVVSSAVKEEKVIAAELPTVSYPVHVNRVFSGVPKVFFENPSYFDNIEIKLYRLSFEKYEKIKDDRFSSIFSEAELCDKWSASESDHQVNLSDGDYFITVSESLSRRHYIYSYYHIADNGSKIQDQYKCVSVMMICMPDIFFRK